MRRRFAVTCATLPAISFYNNILASKIDHRFDTDGHARLQDGTDSSAPVIRHFGILMHAFAYAMATHLADNAVAAPLYICLDSIRHITHTLTGLSSLYPFIEGCLGRVKESLHFIIDLSDSKSIA